MMGCTIALASLGLARPVLASLDVSASLPIDTWPSALVQGMLRR